MDIRKFFNKRLKTDHVIHAVDNDNQCKDLTEDNVCINFASSSNAEHSVNTSNINVADVGLQADYCSQPSTSAHTTSSTPNIKGNTNDSFDIGNCLDNIPTNNYVIYSMLTNPWKPDSSYNFKDDVIAGKRPFLREWYNTYPWLAYSRSGKGALCKSCVLFKPRVSHGSYQSGFITRPFNNYKKFHEYAKSHALSQWHREAVEKSSNFLSVMDGEKQSVDVLVNEGLAHQIESNRNKLKPIVSSIIFCATHDLPLRGKQDTHAVFNDLLRFREESGDVTLADHLKHGPKNASYISHRVQNELIETSANVLRNELIGKINSNEIFSILADETMDISGVEQLSLGVRYFDTSDKCIKEDFLGFTPLQEDGLGAENVASAIISTLTSWGLNLNNVVGQGYDGCSTMAGHITGVHKRINEKFPMALYFHCSSHKLNLVVNDLNRIPQVRNTVGTVKEVIKFFRENGQRRAVIGTLQKLCETRWTEKYKAIRKFNEQFVDIAQALENLSMEGNKDTRQKAFQLHCAVTTTSFLICMQVIAVYSSKLEIVTQMLQSPSVDLLKVSTHIQRLAEIFKSDRTNSVEEFAKIMLTVEQNAAALCVTLTKPRVIGGTQIHRSNQPSETLNDYFRVSVFLPYLDSLVQSLSDRFSEKNQPAFEIFNMHPKVMKALPKEKYESSVVKIAEMYGKLLDNFKDESVLWYDLWANTPADYKDLEKMHLIDVLQHEHVYFLPSVAKALKIALCLPPTTCTIERSFSTLRRVKTWIRSSMSNDRLTGLCLLSVHRNTVKQQKDELIEKTINVFGMDKRRVQFLFKS